MGFNVLLVEIIRINSVLRGVVRCQVYDEVKNKHSISVIVTCCTFPRPTHPPSWNLRNLAYPSAHLLAISIQTILQNDCEWRKLGKIPTKLLRGWATNNKRSRNVAGTQSGGNILRTLRSRRLRNGRITCLPGVTQVRKLGGKTKRLAVDGKTFLETAFAA